MRRVRVRLSGLMSKSRSSWKGTRAPGAGELQAYVAGEVQDVGYGAGCAAVLVEEGKSDKVFECHAVFGYGMGSFFGELRIAGRINMDIFAGGFLRIGEGIHVFQVYYRLARTFGLERLYEKRNRRLS